jgi:hypothetical protein
MSTLSPNTFNFILKFNGKKEIHQHRWLKGNHKLVNSYHNIFHGWWSFNHWIWFTNGQFVNHFLLPLWQPCCIVWKLFNCVLIFLSSTNLACSLHLKFAFENDIKCCSKQKKPIDLFHLCFYSHPSGILEYGLQVLFANKKSSKMMCEIQ